MVINVHAGHNPDGKIACGAVGLVKESTEARKIKDEVIRLLKDSGCTVYDCTVEDGKSQKDVLNKIVKKCNAHKVDLDVSIHLNCGRQDKNGDGKTGGVEVLLYQEYSKAADAAKGVVKYVSDLGYTKRSDASSPCPGIKLRPDLYYLRRASAPAMLIECFFVDDADDVKKYDYKKMAKSIVLGILGYVVDKQNASKETYRVQVGAFSDKENAENMVKKLKSKGFDAYITKS